jgi:hypothetical protein
MKEYYPNDGERAAFVKRIIDDLGNEKYHLYSPVYTPALAYLLIEVFASQVGDPMKLSMMGSNTALNCQTYYLHIGFVVHYNQSVPYILPRCYSTHTGG